MVTKDQEDQEVVHELDISVIIRAHVCVMVYSYKWWGIMKSSFCENWTQALISFGFLAMVESNIEIV